MQLSPAQIRGLARQALAKGDLRLADVLARHLLARNPEDASAHRKYPVDRLIPAERFARTRLMQAASFLSILFLSLFATGATAQAPAPGEQVSLPKAQAKALAYQALARGDVAVAHAISSAILSGDPDDPEMLMVRAILARGAGSRDIARESAASAYASSDDPRLRFDAAMLVADLHAQDENFTRAQLWLRRADQAAKTDQQKAIVADAYRRVSRANPFSVSLSFSLRPSNNINNGSNEEVEGIFGLTGSTEKPVGGTETIASGSLRYRLGESETQKTEGYLSAYVRKAFLESGYEEIVPGATRSEFDFVSLSSGFLHQRIIWPDLGPTAFRLGFGAGYYRNDHYLSFVDGSVAQTFRLDGQSAFRAEVTLRDETRFDSAAASSVSQSFALDYSSRMAGGTYWALGTTYTNFDSNAATVVGSSIELRGQIAPDVWLFGTKPDVSLALGYRDLPAFDYFGTLDDGRQDYSARLRLGLTFTESAWYGFQPRLELTASKTDAEINLWDNESLSAGLTLVSRF